VRADARRHVRRGASRGVAWSRAADASQRIDERRKSSQFWITRMTPRLVNHESAVSVIKLVLFSETNIASVTLLVLFS